MWGELSHSGWRGLVTNVVDHYSSSERGAKEVRRRVEDLGRRCVTVGADLANQASAGIVASAVRSEFGRLDLLVNSAANFRATSLLDIDADEWDQVLNVNLRAASSCPGTRGSAP